ncbi:MAG: DUF4260 domain-containing protein [Anaerolineae bacterium]|nr:DUF4260 domain-containing protein [Anaerolineae bacterium]
MSNSTLSRLSLPAILERLEAIAIAAAAVIAYAYLRGDGVFFIVLLFLPDVSMIGYLANPRVGSVIYDAVHTYLVPAVLLLVGLAFGSLVAVQIALIWITHIGIDRLMGYGLKYPTAFKDTHIQRI